MIKFSPTTDQLKDTLEHIYYEIAQITETLLPETKNIFVNHALVEARLIHIRALLDFFQRSKRRVRNDHELDDVLSLDYGFTQRIVGVPSTYKERLNKDLAHLTYSRAVRLPSDKPWPHNEVVLPMLTCCMEFGEHLISNFLPMNYSEKLSDWQVLVDKIKSIQRKFIAKT